jgi:hypothetical protein
MTKPEDGSDRPSKEMLRILQEELPAIEPPPDVREDMLKRILERTVRSWREWLSRARNRPND